MKISIVGCMALTVVTAWSCRNGEGESEAVDMHRLDTVISHGRMPDDSLEARAVRRLFEISGYPEATVSALGDYSRKLSICSHVGAVESEFADMGRESEALGRIFSSMGRLLPKAELPEVFTVISPFSQSVIIADSMLFVGLNHYLGSDYEPYGYFPDYIRHLKVRDRISVDVAEAIIRTSYPFTPSTEYPNVISRLAYEGAVTLALMRVSGMDEMSALGYEPEQYDRLRKNERIMWDALVSRRLLFSTDGAVTRSLVDMGPRSSVISPDTPGRAGRYIGMSMMREYMRNNPDVTLEELLSPDVYESPDLLSRSGYRP